MKVIVNENNSIKEKPFPKLMINPSTNAIWLMRSRSSGTMINPINSLFGFGDVSDILPTERWIDFDGSITLSND